jgi:hypothetical protein
MSTPLTHEDRARDARARWAARQDQDNRRAAHTHPGADQLMNWIQEGRSTRDSEKTRCTGEPSVVVTIEQTPYGPKFAVTVTAAAKDHEIDKTTSHALAAYERLECELRKPAAGS